MTKGTGGDIYPTTFRKVREKIKDRPEQMVISTTMLCSIQQACYNDVNLGRFGLSAEHYMHLTSSVRCYSDLIVHRLTRKYSIEKSTDDKEVKRREDKSPELAEHTSKCERRAIETGHDTDELKEAEYMIQYIGGEFGGIVGSIVNFGMSIELPNTTEGIVHIANMTGDCYCSEEH